MPRGADGSALLEPGSTVRIPPDVLCTRLAIVVEGGVVVMHLGGGLVVVATRDRLLSVEMGQVRQAATSPAQPLVRRHGTSRMWILHIRFC